MPEFGRFFKTYEKNAGLPRFVAMIIPLYLPLEKRDDSLNP
jgi:hypothetical protein